MKHLTTGNLAWLAAYLLVMASVVGGVTAFRDWALHTFDTPAARAEWQTWRDEATKQAASDGPVKRRIPKSGEPPALRLMRDYFVTCEVLAVVLSSALFATFAFLLRGALRKTAKES